jgi:NAD-dependent dihydropyrimidine dehydrogenase PreA subunit
MDEKSCMVDVAKYFFTFLQEESCGKCTPCREGVKRMRQILNDITEGKGKEEDIALMERLSSHMIDSSICALGSTAPNPVLTTLRYFREEYEAHIKDKKCPAGVCKALITYMIDAEKCNGCTLCATQCPVEAVQGEKKEPHVIVQEKCTKCGICYESCKFDAVVRS